MRGPESTTKAPRADHSATAATGAGHRDAELALVAVMADNDDRLRALAYHLLGSRDAMDDVLQEVYLKAHRRLASFRGDSSLATWLHRITYTTCMDRLRRQRWVRPAPPEEIEDALVPNTGESDALALRDQLHRALAVLSPERCAAVLLVLRDGHTYAEAGEILGVPAGTVASRVSQGRRQLVKELSLEAQGRRPVMEDLERLLREHCAAPEHGPGFETRNSGPPSLWTSPGCPSRPGTRSRWRRLLGTCAGDRARATSSFWPRRSPAPLWSSPCPSPGTPCRSTGTPGSPLPPKWRRTCAGR